MRPQLEVAEETGIKIAIENHGNNLMESPDALKWLFEFRTSENLGIAQAPYPLPQDAEMLSDLIRSLGSGIFMFYAWAAWAWLYGEVTQGGGAITTSR
ncbi:MAG: hypothetical protein O2887_10505 [Bacteroidetes bacterium]|nr:hypothetical protein [Bacteroidota bacterium]MDA1120901.1 hypothetical protein [Bacteroidota bacterium]